ncbi:MBL fold metallo-hydrolase [Solibacillus daqui]|uniref:MBL fold metallo-hydrolase n=1 Tax=Solibacillus daqui TaxID=2912187 RepID=UPI00236597C7|nr:MBL fold metallo-hydrolase [Solibacillus daqui]
MIQYQNEQLTVFQSALYQTTCAVIQTEKAIIITDPNWLPHEVEAIKAYVESRIGNRQLYVIFTHSDFDHIIAAGAFPQAIKIASEAFVNLADKEKVLNDIVDFDAQYYITRDYPITYPTIDIVIRQDGQQEVLGDVMCSFYLAPGHTEDGIFTIVEPLGIMLVGDYLSNVEFPLVSNITEYETTLQKAKYLLEQFEVHALVSGHGQMTTDQLEMENRIEESQDYLTNLQQGVNQEHALEARYSYYRSLKALHEANKKVAARKK